MRSTSILAVSGLVVLVGGAVAPDQAPRAFPGPPPRFVTVGGVDLQTGRLRFINTAVGFVLEPNPAAEKIQLGEGKTAIKSVYRPVYESRGEELEIDSAVVSEAGGEELTREEVLKRAVIGTPMVVSADGRSIDPTFMKAIAKGTLVVVSPRMSIQTAIQEAAIHDGGDSAITVEPYPATPAIP